MGQIYNGTLIIQTKDYDSPIGDYVLAPIANPAQSGDVKDGKQGYDSLGNIVVGTNEGGYAGEVVSYEKMDSFLTEENVGRILKYIGEEQEGTPAPVNPIAVGDILQSTAEGDEGHPILYLNTGVTPDFSQFPEDEMLNTENGGYSLISLDENGGSTPLISAMKLASESGGVVYGILGIETLLYAFSSDVSPSEADLEAWGWQVTSPVIINKWGGEARVTAVNQQDIWGEYISKDGQWTGGAKYKTNQTYIIEQKDGVPKALPLAE